MRCNNYLINIKCILFVSQKLSLKFQMNLLVICATPESPGATHPLVKEGS
jgi:hypothetical protein